MVRRDERGASSIEWALLTPVIILVILCAIQFAMIYHAEHVALAAAQEGARAARETRQGGNWQGNGEGAAQEALNALGPGLLKGDVQITAISDDPDYERGVSVSGQAPSLLWFTFRVTKVSIGPVECFRPDDPDTQAKTCIDGG
ncbi:hypothetical protein GCM10027589_52090 [Actinocorallia lasiicapitis]